MNAITGALAYPDWTRDAACADVGPGIFFPAEDANGDGSWSYAADARRICAGCPVVDECLEYALAFESGVEGTAWVAHGVYGGCTPAERRKILRARATDMETAS